MDLTDEVKKDIAGHIVCIAESIAEDNDCDCRDWREYVAEALQKFMDDPIGWCAYLLPDSPIEDVMSVTEWAMDNINVQTIEALRA